MDKERIIPRFPTHDTYLQVIVHHKVIAVAALFRHSYNIKKGYISSHSGVVQSFSVDFFRRQDWYLFQKLLRIFNCILGLS
jgi:hypothetical protein